MSQEPMPSDVTSDDKIVGFVALFNTDCSDHHHAHGR